MRIDPSDDCRQHALHCVRMSQMSNSLEAREIWSDLAKTWLRFASDLEANHGLLDEWGKPKLRSTPMDDVAPPVEHGRGNDAPSQA